MLTALWCLCCTVVGKPVTLGAPPVRKQAAAGYYTVAFDLRGHGDSDWSPVGAYSQEDYVQNIEAVVEILGRRKPILVGASLGAGAALLAAGEGRVDAVALILADFVPRTERSGFERLKTFMLAHA